MRVLLTRAREQAEEMASELRARGHQVIVSPLWERQFVEIPGGLGGIGALVFTSMNGASAMAKRIPEELLSVPVFTVGGRTAEAARRVGFNELIVGPGQARELVPLITGFEGKIDGRIVHISGEDVRTDVAALLRAEGLAAERLAAYRMVAQSGLSDEAVSAIRKRQLDAVLFFSPRSAKLFATLIEAGELTASLDQTVAIALSDAVAGPLRDLSWAEIRVARRPNRQAMLKLLEDNDQDGRTAP
jgi:uroporphyrinogen-III synthase